ncbi:MAG: entericidin A/B family lipoprotein [Acetobacteraceae bacterium]|nr:entericidin A/B family lipoprotein [Acetobacteraceae bacterium]
MRLFLLLAMLSAPLLLSACHTAEGVGQDLGSAGRTISNTASDVQKKL